MSVKAVHRAARHSGHIDRELQGADDAMVTVGQRILFVYKHIYLVIYSLKIISTKISGNIINANATYVTPKYN